MAVRKIRNWWWVDFSFEGERYRKKSPENSRAGAEVYELRLRQRLRETGTILPPKQDSPTFSQFSEEWFKTYVRTNLKPSTIRKYAYALSGHLIPAFGSQRIAAITGDEIERYKQRELRAGLKAKTINGYLSILRRCLDTALDWRLLGSIPRFKWLRCEPPAFDFLSFAESARLLEAAKEAPWRLMIHCALRTGLRVGELIALRWEWVDFDRRLLTVRRSCVRGIESSPKSNRIRHVHISADLAFALAEGQRPTGHVFARPDGSPVKHEAARRALGRILRAAGIRRVGWHTLRHTFASQLSSRGVPLQAIQSFLGHSTIEMTMRYAHLMPSAYAGAVDELAKGEAVALLGSRHSAGTERDLSASRNHIEESNLSATHSKEAHLVGELLSWRRGRDSKGDIGGAGSR